MQIVKKEYVISEELEYEILRFGIGHYYIKQEASLSEYFSESKKCTVQNIKFEYAMPLKIPKKEIMGNIDIHGHSILSIIEHGYNLNGININVYKHDKKFVYVDILFIRNKDTD
jgi:hypothetical protein